MSIDLYRVLHIVGLVLLSLALGGTLLGAKSDEKDAKPSKLPSILHGVGLLIILVAGFGMMARLGMEWPWPGWMFGKLGVWLLLGAMPVLARKNVVPPAMAWFVALALAATAIYLVKYRPF